MKEIVDFVYSKYPHFVASYEQLLNLFTIHKDKVICVREAGEIKGVGFFLRLSDESFNKLGTLDIFTVDVMRELLKENGDNIHFIQIAADSVKTLVRGLRLLREREHPASISGYHPDMKKLYIKREVELCQ